ncbi:uncharacterized protein CMU_000780 [Cryptosporidium muris RN66]|uniref:Uncharacterized protein n=1 Tax=Cryptosporidium muris (strain RN66) TaxID=441375 RepID=B6AG67_CRYMR|nr:uncharacterized protein CMU_000780 [Cryptosporidium muris RN66]EEA07208.1 hypothetical protein, conserved [Cryptosporidium muris RN66]|eukprot:XP_002141557.1 hypothetical protein [Cryptosporidium muris RN66]
MDNSSEYIRLFSGDIFGTIKEVIFDKSEIDLKTKTSVNTKSTEVNNSLNNRITYIAWREKESDGLSLLSGNCIERIILDNDSSTILNELIIGRKNGIVELLHISLLDNKLSFRTKFIFPSSIILIQDVTKQYIKYSDNKDELFLLVIDSKCHLCIFKWNCAVKHMYNEDNEFIKVDTWFFEERGSTPDWLVHSTILPGSNILAATYNSVNNSVAFGGYENNLKIYSLKLMKITWKCRNVSSNALKHRIPVYIRCLAFVQLDPQLLLCGTGTGDIRLYSPTAQRKPIFSKQIWEDKSPVTSIAIAKQWSLFKDINNTFGCVAIVGNNIGSVSIIKLSAKESDKSPIDFYVTPTKRPSALANISFKQHKRQCIQKGEENKIKAIVPKYSRENSIIIEYSVMGSLKGIMGGISCISCLRLKYCKSDSTKVLVAITGPGRFIYIYDLTKRRMIKKIHTHQKMCFILWDPSIKKEEK